MNEIIILAKNGHLQEALEKCKVIQPEDAPVPLLNLAAAISSMLGDYETELLYMNNLVKREPTNIEYIKNTALVLTKLAHFDQSIEIWLELIKFAPEDFQVWLELANNLKETGRFVDAIKASKKASLLNPLNANTYFIQGVCYWQLEHFEEALIATEKSLMLEPENPVFWRNKAIILETMKKPDEAIKAIKKCLDLDPNVIAARATLVSLLEANRKTEEAKFEAENVLSFEPWNSVVHLSLARIERLEKKHEQAIHRLKSLLNQDDVKPEHISESWIELGANYDKLGQTENAFAAITKGKSIRENSCTKLFSEYLTKITAMHNYLGSQNPTNAEILKPAKLIFLVGFPRSGTTLMEQILHAHPQVESLDERPLMLETVNEYIIEHNPSFKFPSDFSNLAKDQLDILRKIYLKRAQSYSVSNAEFILDKMPLNITNMAILQKLFPEVPTIVMLRDPRDCVISGYFQSLQSNAAMIHFLRPDTSANLYTQVMGLWLKTKEQLTDLKFIEVKYEELCDDFQKETNRVLDFLHLEWSDEIGLFHTKAAKRHISTPSYQAVSTPIFTSSVGRWKNYENQISGILPVLEPFVTEFGYH